MKCGKQSMTFPKDIEAEIYFLTPEEGGRSGPAFDNYRPQFYYNGKDWDASHVYPDVEQALPGETVRAYIAFLSPKEHFGNVHIGMKFLIREGARTVGRGIIKEIIELERSVKNES